jgi:hypothetical protein
MAVTIANYNVNGAFPSTVGGTGVAIKYFPNIPGASIGVNNVTPSATSANGQLAIPSNNRLNGQYFTVLASGDFEVGSGGACPSATIALYANVGTILTPSYVTLATTGAITTQALTGAFYPWYIVCDLQGSTNSGIVQGKFASMVDGTSVVSATLTNNLSGINFNGASPATPAGLVMQPPFGLVIGITFSVSEPGNSANLYEFQVNA